MTRIASPHGGSQGSGRSRARRPGSASMPVPMPMKMTGTTALAAAVLIACAFNERASARDDHPTDHPTVLDTSPTPPPASTPAPDELGEPARRRPAAEDGRGGDGGALGGGSDAGLGGEAPDRPPAPGSPDLAIDRLCAAAVETALADPERARALVVRARLAGWLPEMGFRVYRRWARTEGVTLEDPVTGAPIPVDIKAIDDVRYEWRATWDLSRIVFNPDEISAHLEALRMADVRRDIQLMVIRLYFERKRVMAELSPRNGVVDRRPASDRQRGNLRILEIEAELDALSGGAFSQARARDESATSSSQPPR
jgi:hypothetical protein